jgi:putative zinc finger/helix-turn-helix YgiT family protein
MQNEIIQLPTAERRDCECCGAAAALRMRYTVQKFNYGSESPLIELSAQVPVWTCDSCGDQHTDEKAEGIRHEVVCRYLHRLTPRDIKRLRELYGLTQVEFAELTGFGAASIKRWESGSLIQGLAQDRFMRLLEDQHTMLALQKLANRPDDILSRSPRFRTKLSEDASQHALSFDLRVGSTLARKA